MQEILRVKNLKKSFGPKTVHRNVSFSLKSGEMLGLLGNSGTGKSVLLRCLIGLETMDDGEVWFKDDRIDLLKEEQLFKYRIHISYAFQNGALFDSLSVYDNVSYPLLEHTKLRSPQITEKVTDMLKLVHLEEAGNLFPSDLSGGMQKRAGLARAMILNPEIMLYDECTAGLDPVNVDNVLEIMNSFKARGAAGIFITHDIPAAKKVCDRFLILEGGRIAFEGNLQQFEQSTDEVVRRFQLGQ